MHLENLRVVHLSKKVHGTVHGRIDLELKAQIESSSGGFCLDTCQRWVWVLDSESSIWARVRSLMPKSDFYPGKSAYLFLLRLATGLESEILGETDIFGQMKEAWRIASETKDFRGTFFPGLLSRLFEDTKEIRSRHIQNWGGASYGSLVRKVIRDHSQKTSVALGPVFLVGAGQIAQSIAPFLLDSELWIWNRNAERLFQMQEDLRSKLTEKEWSGVRFLVSDEQAQQAWREARHTVVAIPADDQTDRVRVRAWSQGGMIGRSLTHLGGRRENCQVWVDACSDGFFALDDLFSMQDSLDRLRSIQVARAVRACEERVQLRALGGSISIPHGWEDLACFA